ncbi:MAG: HDOD domain-containing protein [Phycisphaera sp.]|nr:HDOD domain-containing protein [Phycisphaera sp.]
MSSHVRRRRETMTQLSTHNTAGPSVAGSNDQAAVDKIVQSALAEISHIATLPEITLKIIRLVEDPDSSAQDLNKVITNDPALGARILKVVNSAFYGLPGQIGSINRAIVLLGLNAVKNIAIAASLAKLFRGGQVSPHFNARDLWQHCIAVGTATRLLSDKVGLGAPDEAFLGGLIHDLGVMVEMQARRTKFAEVIEKVRADDKLAFRTAETEILGVSHEQFGTGLCKLWKFPNNFAFVTGFHHRPRELPESSRQLPTLVHIADIAAAKAGIGYTRTVETLEVDPEFLTWVKLTQTQVDEVVTQLPEAINEASSLLNDSGL